MMLLRVCVCVWIHTEIGTKECAGVCRFAHIPLVVGNLLVRFFAILARHAAELERMADNLGGDIRQDEQPPGR